MAYDTSINSGNVAKRKRKAYDLSGGNQFVLVTRSNGTKYIRIVHALDLLTEKTLAERNGCTLERIDLLQELPDYLTSDIESKKIALSIVKRDAQRMPLNCSEVSLGDNGKIGRYQVELLIDLDSASHKLRISYLGKSKVFPLSVGIAHLGKRIPVTLGLYLGPINKTLAPCRKFVTNSFQVEDLA